MKCTASTTVNEILDDLWCSATSEADKGSKFERLMAAYLRTDPTFADQFSDVWLWQEWPGRDGKHDTGIDLVAKDRVSGNLVAVQCKFYDPTGTIAKPDVDSFLAASGKAGFAERIIVSTTERWNANAEDAIRDQQIPVRRIGRSPRSRPVVERVRCQRRRSSRSVHCLCGCTRPASCRSRCPRRPRGPERTPRRWARPVRRWLATVVTRADNAIGMAMRPSTPAHGMTIVASGRRRLVRATGTSAMTRAMLRPVAVMVALSLWSTLLSHTLGRPRTRSERSWRSTVLIRDQVVNPTSTAPNTTTAISAMITSGGTGTAPGPS